MNPASQTCCYHIAALSYNLINTEEEAAASVQPTTKQKHHSGSPDTDGEHVQETLALQPAHQHDDA